MEQMLTIVAYGFGVLYAVVSLGAVGMWVCLSLTRGGTTTMWSLDPREAARSSKASRGRATRKRVPGPRQNVERVAREHGPRNAA